MVYVLYYTFVTQTYQPVLIKNRPEDEIRRLQTGCLVQTSIFFGEIKSVKHVCFQDIVKSKFKAICQEITKIPKIFISC